jgi:hypothetical protein
VVAVCLMTVAVLFALKRKEQWLEPLAADHEIQRFSVEGNDYLLADDGVVYRLDGGGRRSWHARVFDPELIRRSYRTVNGAVHRVDPDSGQSVAVRRELREGFEELPTGLDGLKRLMGVERGWGAITLQTPRFPTIPDYVGHRNRLLKGEEGFLDGRLEPVSEGALVGSRSLRALAPAKPSSMICTKASMSSPLVRFVEDDRVRVEALVKLEKGRPFGLIDLECEFVEGHPGVRLVLWDGTLGAELKSVKKHKFRQPRETAREFPVGKPVRIRFEVLLRGDEKGRVLIAQDGVVVVDQPGPTLPYSAASVNSLEVGISAHDHPSEPCVLLLDELSVSVIPATEPWGLAGEKPPKAVDPGSAERR